MKKKLITTLIVLLLSSCLFPVSFVAQAALPASIEDPVAPAAEQTVWYNRIYNGKLQKRLWSITWGEWLTDWIDVE